MSHVHSRNDVRVIRQFNGNSCLRVCVFQLLCIRLMPFYFQKSLFLSYFLYRNIPKLIMIRFKLLFWSKMYHQGIEFGDFVSKCNVKDCRLKFVLLFLYNFDRLLEFYKIFNPLMYFSSGFYQLFLTSCIFSVL
ncbi:unnamed protein product [Chrysodeixis includens]|uniref:Uncharacterized protein n=1 Tax=Chrysodeixis includens TaxID=689277 RepID=A0A9P0BG89_CHRIL|nr:unnamed protein product [Chrysodeixis includens]